MARWHLNELHDGLTSVGWRVLEQTPGDGWRHAGSWVVQRSTRYDQVILDFEGPDEGPAPTLDTARACHVRAEPILSLSFREKGDAWRHGLRAFVSSLDFSEGRFTLLYTLLEHGNARANLWADGQHLTVYVWHFGHDPLGDLADSIVRLLRSPDQLKVTSAWTEEPGENRWVIERQGNDVSIRIIYFDDIWSEEADDEGEIEFAASCSLLRLASQVLGQLRLLLAEYGEDGYRERSQSPFPTASLAELSELMKES